MLHPVPSQELASLVPGKMIFPIQRWWDVVRYGPIRWHILSSFTSNSPELHHFPATCHLSGSMNPLEIWGEVPTVSFVFFLVFRVPTVKPRSCWDLLVSFLPPAGLCSFGRRFCHAKLGWWMDLCLELHCCLSEIISGVRGNTVYWNVSMCAFSRILQIPGGAHTHMSRKCIGIPCQLQLLTQDLVHHVLKWHIVRLTV